MGCPASVRRLLSAALVLPIVSTLATQSGSCASENPPGNLDRAQHIAIAIPKTHATTDDEYLKLREGQVLTSLSEDGEKKFVTGRILIDEPPEKVWKVMVNPFEFERKISPRMTKVEVIEDEESKTVLRCSMEIGFFIPSITYVVESQYEKFRQVSFRRIGGVFKDFLGSWILIPHDNATRTEIRYSMYIDTGMPVPKWIVREAVKMELPKTLTALRTRIFAVHEKSESPIAKTIQAAD